LFSNDNFGLIAIFRIDYMEKSTRYSASLALLTVLFFMWGFITCLNDILIPHFKNVFQLSFFESSLVQFSFFGAYFVGSLLYFIVSVFQGDPINRIGYKNGILAGLSVSAVGTFLFYPAAQQESFGFFLTALFVLGLGLTLLQITSNPYVSILGEPQHAANRLNLAQGFNSLGTTLAPILGGAFILSEIQEPGIHSVEGPYLFLSFLFVALLLIFFKARLPIFRNEHSPVKGASVLKFPQLSWGILAICFYVGGEVAVGSFIIAFAKLPEITGLNENEATVFVSLYWGSLMIGRFTGAVAVLNLRPMMKNLLSLIIPPLTFVLILVIFYIKGFSIQELLPYFGFTFVAGILFILSANQPSRTLMLFSVVSVLLLVVTVLSSGSFAMWTLVGVGLFNSVMWPVIFTLAIKNLGQQTAQGSSLLVMAILGGALIPPFQGLFADQMGVQVSYLVPAFCYLYLIFYGFKTYRIFGNSIS
jgi:MFS transporter, FHS family, L-fucose permease